MLTVSTLVSKTKSPGSNPGGPARKLSPLDQFVFVLLCDGWGSWSF